MFFFDWDVNIDNLLWYLEGLLGLNFKTKEKPNLKPDWAFYIMAEGERFELSVPYGTAVFKTAAIDQLDHPSGFKFVSC